jgi:cyclopropane fatty-acyl-phospholipid synthase-like methyltransferase
VIDDVPSPIDLRLMRDAAEWEATAMSKRPWRAEFFARMEEEIAAAVPPARRILELGSGPGFLAQHLLQNLDGVSYVMLDFSAAMHQLARRRLGALSARAEFVERDFKQPGWDEGLGAFDCVLTMQAVHELRHKRHAPALHERVRELLAPGGFYLVCDHYCGTDAMRNDQLYMTADEQRSALAGAGFTSIEELLRTGGMVLQRAACD